MLEQVHNFDGKSTTGIRKVSQPLRCYSCFSFVHSIHKTDTNTDRFTPFAVHTGNKPSEVLFSGRSRIFKRGGRGGHKIMDSCGRG